MRSVRLIGRASRRRNFCMSQSEVHDAAPQPVAPSSTGIVQQTVYPTIFAIAFCHMLNDMMQPLEFSSAAPSSTTPSSRYGA